MANTSPAMGGSHSNSAMMRDVVACCFRLGGGLPGRLAVLACFSRFDSDNFLLAYEYSSWVGFPGLICCAGSARL